MTRPDPVPQSTGAAESANDAACAAVTLARSQAPLRRVLAALAGRVVEGRTWERFGFVRLADYARERLGVSARQLQELAHTDEALCRLPRVESALVAGEITWTQARLVARVATPADEEHWLGAARQLSARGLSREVRKVDLRMLHGCGRGGPRPRGMAGPPPERELQRENILLECSVEARGRWYRARQYAQRVAGRRLAPWECVDAVLGEVLSGMDLEIESPGAPWYTSAGLDSLASIWPKIDTRPLGADAPSADGCAGQAIGSAAPAAAGCRKSASSAGAGPPASAAPPASAIRDDPTTAAPRERLPVFLRDLLVGLAEADAFELDARFLRALRLEQSFHARLGPLLLEVSRARMYRGYGCTRMDDFASEHLGMSPRSVQALLRVERAAARCDPLGKAYREGRLSSEQAMALVPLAHEEDADEQCAEWVDHAQRATVKQLADDVDRALATGIFDPAALATRESWDSPAPAAKSEASASSSAATAESDPADPEDLDGPQIGAQHRGFGKRSMLYIHAPRDVARLFRATLSAVQRAIERREDRSSDESEALIAMIDHAIETWKEMHAPHARRYPVEERDGFQCTVPGCTSYDNLHNNLHDHHIRFRSAGGSDLLSNRTTLCAAHHQRGVHAGRMRCSGSAPDGLRFELGLREGHPPLVRYAASAGPERRPTGARE
ncbi:MAG: HNH endonuclease [Deltaproteobacteria bacterium]|nr:HNH endonuclease [Deltaproteobacteria bacterium]MBW2418019.1 HNH endonuclease [Deltaproteobacteria bacterium]